MMTLNSDLQPPPPKFRLQVCVTHLGYVNLGTEPRDLVHRNQAPYQLSYIPRPWWYILTKQSREAAHWGKAFGEIKTVLSEFPARSR